jgi:hypothetical protein
MMKGVEKRNTSDKLGSFGKSTKIFSRSVKIKAENTDINFCQDQKNWFGREVCVPLMSGRRWLNSLNFHPFDPIGFPRSIAVGITLTGPRNPDVEPISEILFRKNQA